ncbi:MAG: FAD-dependent oxidoreductase [Thermoanaerobaculia bacterium]|nr:FAD-dependent oxidoreductase [Thermoanaerobaculia bacterium]
MSQPDGVMVSCRGRQYQGDAALVTFPVGVLASGDITFTPPLPAAKQRAIADLGMGVLDKLALRFPRAFWQPSRDLVASVDRRHGHFPVFLDLYRHTGVPILVAFHAGREARRLQSKAEAAVVRDAMVVLRRIFGRGVPEPEAVVRSTWAADPFSRGSYSYLPTGTSADLFDQLAEPFERLFFAGEATNRTHLATVHGAYLSGLREAERIAKSLPRFA